MVDTITSPNAATRPSIDEAVVVYELHLDKPGCSGKVGDSEAEVRATDSSQAIDRKRLKLTKRLFDCPEYRAVSAHDGAIRSYLRSQALPTTKLAGGRYPIAAGRIELVDERVQELFAERTRLVDLFVAAYPAAVEAVRLPEEQGGLGALFAAADYPSPEAMASQFSASTELTGLNMPGTGLARISRSLYARELAKVSSAREAMVTEIRDGLRAAAHGLVSTLVSTLKPKAPGERPRVFASQVDKLKAFLADFGSLNVAGDDALEGLVTRARELVDGADPEEMRKDTSVRDSFASGLLNVEQALAVMVSADATALRANAVAATLNDATDRATETRAAELDAQEAAPVEARRLSIEVDGVTPARLAPDLTPEADALPTLAEILAATEGPNVIPHTRPSGARIYEEARTAMAERRLELLTRRRDEKLAAAAEEAARNAPKVRRIDDAPPVAVKAEPVTATRFIDW